MPGVIYFGTLCAKYTCAMPITIYHFYLLNEFYAEPSLTCRK